MRGRALLQKLDGWAVGAALFLSVCGLWVLAPWGGASSSHLFYRQLLWVALGLVGMFVAYLIPLRFWARRSVVVALYAFTLFLLVVTLFAGSVFQGAQSWIDVGFAAIQPTELAKLALVLLLAKYLARRHVAIGQWRHVVVSGIYGGALILLVLAQPDLGSAVVLALLWLVMVLAAGIPLRTLAVVSVVALVGAAVGWVYVLTPYQKERVIAFLSPATNVLAEGYSSWQSLIAIGSGGIFGKGVGFGTQSRLAFLPEYETDFMFAAFAEEWGFIGVVAVLLAFVFLIARMLRAAQEAQRNFAKLVAIGCAAIIAIPFSLHTAINLGLLPVTGLALPFMSYGGSHTLVEWVALGITLAATSRH